MLFSCVAFKVISLFYFSSCACFLLKFFIHIISLFSKILNFTWFLFHIFLYTIGKVNIIITITHFKHGLCDLKGVDPKGVECAAWLPLLYQQGSLAECRAWGGKMLPSFSLEASVPGQAQEQHLGTLSPLLLSHQLSHPCLRRPGKRK